jgi:hypothetical protein
LKEDLIEFRQLKLPAKTESDAAENLRLTHKPRITAPAKY